MKILILGGTAEARELANRLVGMGHDVTTSLAGRTQDPMLPQGGLRMGKFGGVPGLAAALAGKNALDMLWRHGQKVGRDQRVMNDDIGLAQRVIGEQRYKARTAGPGADQPDRAGLHGGKIGAVERCEMG